MTHFHEKSSIFDQKSHFLTSPGEVLEGVALIPTTYSHMFEKGPEGSGRGEKGSRDRFSEVFESLFTVLDGHQNPQKHFDVLHTFDTLSRFEKSGIF